MSDLFSLRVTTLLAICVLLYLAAAAQAVHACFVAMRHVKGKRGLLIWYEALITVSLALACATVNSVLENYGVVLIWLYPLAIPIEPLLWFNVVLAALGAACAIRLRRPGLICDAALFLCRSLFCAARAFACSKVSGFDLIASTSFFIGSYFHERSESKHPAFLIPPR